MDNSQHGPTQSIEKQTPGLIVIGGLPGTGKSSIAVALSRRLRSAYLRIDTIEQSLVDSGELPEAPRAAGYLTGYALAADQLRVGLSAVAECVNPLEVTRAAWRRIADEQSCWIVEVELICSDPDEHRRRVEHRSSDIPGLVLPTWQQVLDRSYETWDHDHLVIDSSTTSVESSVELICQHVFDAADRA